MKQFITLVFLLLFFTSCKKKDTRFDKSMETNPIEKGSSVVKILSQNDSIIQKILTNKDILKNISLTYKNGYDHIVIQSKIIFNQRNIQIDTMNFTLSKEYLTDKDVVIEIDSINTTLYRFTQFFRNGNEYYNGLVKKKEDFWTTKIESYEVVDNVYKNRKYPSSIYLNDTIIQKILYNKDVLKYLSSAYKKGYNHLVINSVTNPNINFSKKNIQIDSMNFSLSKEYKTDKDIVIKLESLHPTSYMFKMYSPNINTRFYGSVKKDSLWKVRVRSFK